MHTHYFDSEPTNLPDLLRQATHPLESPADFDPLLKRIGDARVVMLGEATHGTSEFYTWRARLSQRLIEEKGFHFIAVEGDWPECYHLNRFIKDYVGSDLQALDAVTLFHRWPTWMWANWETVALVDWLRRHNRERHRHHQVGFFGLDVYSLRESLISLLDYLEDKDPESLQAAREAFRCFEPHGLQGQNYARAALVGDDCQDEAVALLKTLANKVRPYNGDLEEELSARQNARVVKNAEDYYRTMVYGGPDSWNIRDRHMARTLDDLLDFHGPDAKAIVWEHNTHIGDARYTDMARSGMFNLGQLGRELYGEDDVVLVGFGTHRGRVIAGDQWGAPMQSMVVPPALPHSWEDLFHRSGQQDCLLIMDQVEQHQGFARPRGHRAIGVVYRGGDRESPGQYVPTDLTKRYDAFVFIDESQALHPLHIRPDRRLEPDTFPWGL